MSKQYIISKRGDNIQRLNIELNDSVYHQLARKAGNSGKVPLLAEEMIKQDVDYSPNIEQAKFIGYTVLGGSIVKDYDTVVLGGTNYNYQVINAKGINKKNMYRVINFTNGKIILKQL